MRADTIGRASIMLGDWREALPGLGFGIDALVSDPPYGIGYKVNARTPRGAMLKGVRETATAAVPSIAGDDRPFDPRPLLTCGRMIALCGAHHFAHLLPPGGSWLVWDKRRDQKPDDHSDGDTIWLSVPGVLRIHRQAWRGVVREGEENCSRSRKLHPNQKPVALMTAILRQIGIGPGSTVADPYMGSGSTGVAALRLGARFIGCEIDPAHYETAHRRITEMQP